MLRGKAIMAALAALLPGAHAAAADYDYVQLEYLSSASKVVLDGADTEADYDGYGLSLSKAFSDTVFGFGELKLAETDDVEVGGTPVNDSAFDFNRYSLGLGLRNGNEVVDLYGALSYERLSIEHETGHGWGLTGGLRLTYAAGAGMGFDRVEVHPRVKYLNYGDIDGVRLGSGSRVDIGSIDGFEYGLSTVVYLTPAWALSVDYSETSLSADFGDAYAGEDPGLDLESELAVGLRYSF